MNQAVDIARILARENVNRCRIRGITKLLDAPRRIESDIKDLSHAEFRKFYTILQRKHNLAAFAFVNVHADKHLEKAIACSNGIVMDIPIAGLQLHLFNFIRKGIDLCT